MSCPPQSGLALQPFLHSSSEREEIVEMRSPATSLPNPGCWTFGESPQVRNVFGGSNSKGEGVGRYGRASLLFSSYRNKKQHQASKQLLHVIKTAGLAEFSDSACSSARSTRMVMELELSSEVNAIRRFIPHFAPTGIVNSRRSIGLDRVRYPLKDLSNL